MKKILYKVIIVITLLLCTNSNMYSQQYTSLGKEFWLGFMENYSSFNNPVDLYIYISSRTNTSGTIDIPLGTYSQSFNVAANSTLKIKIPTNAAMSTESEQTENKAIHIISDDPITVYALNYAYRTSDAALILPVQTLGTEYFVQSYNTNDPEESLIQIVPIGEETVVQITPSQRTKFNKPAGVPYSVTLLRGQSYQIKSRGAGDLTGTKVEVISGEPIAVFGGAKCTFVGDCDCCCDHLFDQMFPIKETGMREFITVPYQTRKGDLFRIIAFEDNTIVLIDDKPIPLSNEGDVYETLIYNPSHILSNKPISVGHYSRSRECDGNMDSDPFYINLSSTEMKLDTITFNAFDSDEIENYFVNIVTLTNNTSSVFYNGVNIANLFEHVATKPEFSYAQVSTRQGDHTLISAGGVIAYVYGYGVRESYGYSAGINLFGKITVFECEPTTYQAGDTVNYQIQINETSSIETIGDHKYSATLRFNQNLLRPLVDSSVGYKNDGILVLNGTKKDLRSKEILEDIKFKAMLGDRECTNIYLDSLTWDRISYPINSECEVCIELCEEGGKRLILSTDTLSLSAITPNPVFDEAQIEYTLIESGETSLTVSDHLGRQVLNLFENNAKAGNYSLKFDTSELQSGFYYCILKTPSGKLMRKMYIVR